MTVKEVLRKYFSRTEADYFLYNYECNLCHEEFEPDTTGKELYEHLKLKHPTLACFK